MVMQTLEQEPLSTIKAVRLRFLEQAGVRLALGDPIGCQVFCSNFCGTVPRDNDAYPEIVKLQETLEGVKSRLFSEIDQMDEGRFLEQHNNKVTLKPAAVREFCRFYVDCCWDIGIRNKLIDTI